MEDFIMTDMNELYAHAAPVMCHHFRSINRQSFSIVKRLAQWYDSLESRLEALKAWSYI